MLSAAGGPLALSERLTSLAHGGARGDHFVSYVAAQLVVSLGLPPPPATHPLASALGVGCGSALALMWPDVAPRAAPAQAAEEPWEELVMGISASLCGSRQCCSWSGLGGGHIRKLTSPMTSSS